MTKQTSALLNYLEGGVSEIVLNRQTSATPSTARSSSN